MSTDPGHSRRFPRRHSVAAMLLAGAVLGLACVGATADAPEESARGPDRGPWQPLIRVQYNDIGPSAAADAAARATGGKVLNVKRGSGGGGAVYYVKVLLGGGKLRIVKVNAQDGTVE